jgi:uncharacterized membrane protein YqjE
MAAQETMKANGQTPPLGKNLSGFARDVVTLTELQFKLLAVDCRDARITAGQGLMLLGAGAVLALAVVPILLVAIAFVLIEVADWSHWSSFLTAGAISLAIAGLCGWYGWRRMKSATSTFQRSRAELSETFQWIKETLRHQATDSESLCRRM